VAKPSSQVCASWAKEDISGSEWSLLSATLVAAIRRRINAWPEEVVYEFVEANIHHVAEHLRDEAAEWSIDGKPPIFEIDNEQDPYIRGCPGVARPLLDYMRTMDPFAFESLCGRILTSLGANGAPTQRTHDGGIDFQATGLRIVQANLGVPLGSHAAVVGQAKRYKDGNLVRETQVREFVGAAVLRLHEFRINGRIGPLCPVLYAFWTTSDLDRGAKSYARSMGIWYMDGETLATYVENLGGFSIDA
jgi:hypothetical protein